VYLIGPAVVPRRLSAALDQIFDFDVNKCLWAAAKTPSSRVVDIGDGVNAQRKVTTEGFSLSWNVETII
jgi:hypothetical protein